MTTQNTEARQAALNLVKSHFGMVPNLMRDINLQSPALVTAYIEAAKALGQGALSPREREVISLVVSTENDCHYCTAAHHMASKMTGAPPADLDAIRVKRLPEDGRLSALAEATRLLMDKRGFLSRDDLERLSALGVDRTQLSEIIGLIGLKTITNYFNHINKTELDAPFKPYAR